MQNAIAVFVSNCISPHQQAAYERSVSNTSIGSQWNWMMTLSNITERDDLQPPLVKDEQYMLLPIERGFNWHDCFANVTTGEWYLVVFRSKHRHDADKEFLYWLDHQASEAAQQTPGFLYYFTGVPLATGECLSFCLWTDRQAAVAGSSHFAHRVAREMGLLNYEYYCLQRYLVSKQDEKLAFRPVEPLVNRERPVYQEAVN